MDLRMYHGKRIAVVIRRAGTPHLFCGLAAFENDANLGPILRIPVQDGERGVAGSPAFILQPDAPAECLVADVIYGCDFRMEVGIEDNPGL